MVTELVATLLRLPSVTQVVVTRNVPELLALPVDPRLTVVENQQPAGFGANHNAAFRHCRERWFCVLNPDIELIEDPFPQLVEILQQQGAALVAPRILGASGQTEDSFRSFPTVASLTAKALFCQEGRFPYDEHAEFVAPDWVAGMFMLVDTRDFVAVDGFDESYFLYYEDVDLCARLRQRGRAVLVDLTVSARHQAQRASHRNLTHLRWHLISLSRFLWRYRRGVS
ncbi:glycosyltransferase [Roseibium sediminis]|uniref:glycosyltransferase n=1 Tax=Roseibium sediminis TaxID=1775174 RepID=UPI0019578128|nr:glycosyltransferase [Roseibium sediminis]